MDFVSDPAFEADFILTQVVSHHALDRVEAFAAGLEERGIDLPVVWGVFYYRSASRKTLEILNQFFPVPVAELEAEFAEGHSPEEICRRTIHGLRSVGADKIYVSNLGARGGARRLAQIMTGLEP